MAAKPITRAAHKRIADAGGEPFILAEVSSGRTLKDIAESLEISRPLLSSWCNAPARRDAYARAKREAANSLIDQSLEIVDAADPTTAQLAKIRADTRRWIAGKLDREAWGDGPSTAVQINVHGAHLEALRQKRPAIDGEARDGEQGDE